MPHLEFPVAPEEVGTSPTQFDELQPYFLNEEIWEDVTYRVCETLCVLSSKARCSAILRVQLLPEPFDASVKELTAICKVGWGREHAQRVKKEAELCRDKLSHLQGDGLPWIYGCYDGVTDEGVTRVSVMEDCGQSLHVPLVECPPTFRYLACGMLVEVHKAGVIHNSFTERNVVVSVINSGPNKGEHVPVLVGFGEATEHQCPLNGNIQANGLRPERSDIMCDEIYYACMDSDFWRPAYIKVLDTEVPIAHATSVESLVQHAGYSNSNEMLKRRALLEARRAFSAHRD
ncbi:hypothetical protein BD309DRAFT_969341 [Dichomitus squalens]|uniref:Protein kinase domain-containing protein n=1 Tax=Dichomitus squalens (strain LYAD-421) TaxID=732165 RepID=R7SXJ2_DICSQ|nr:uncharacterized protein DICSQDRAFT_156189 [Dichomitus squalens LYAD-421 SS1]EJF59682.1 hypothetical protein DICSQDRAFT_156189 [Dichomitus squalens LYAD-421 SS1]TBU39604.1 hypothetical protein BD309DRAFT_969341 [Dichomitus squalens]